jgi:alpha-1,2-mannosyltransferase
VSVAIGTAALVTVFTVRFFMYVGIPEAPDAPLPLAWWQELVASPFPLAGLLLLILGPLWIRRHFPARSAVGSPATPDAELLATTPR